MKPIRQKEYDFANYRASEGRAAIHDYPAMLHYLLVQRILNEFAAENATVFDPFCGSGVTIIEALKKKLTVYGTDINPLALLIAKARTLNLDIQKTKSTINSICDELDLYTPEVPIVKNLDYWFKPKVINELSKLRTGIKNIADESINTFLKVVFSQTVRSTSNNRKGEFKRFRIPEKALSNYNPSPKTIFMTLAEKYLGIIAANPLPKSYHIFSHDVRYPLPINDEINFIITSPPYGDSRTTVAYGQFSSFSLDWLRGMNPFGDEDLKLDSKMLGGTKTHFENVPSKILEKVLKKIPEPRNYDISLFFL